MAVWIYGGGFVVGGTSPAIYDGSAFAKQDTIFVSVNYRLGRFGFFAHPAISASKEGPLGNYGLLDQIAALQWVKSNIAGFGGDPERITIMGESAGGVSVLNLMASPLAHGLFRQAFVMSGGGRRLLAARPLRSGIPGEISAESIGQAFAAGVGIMGSDPTALRQLRALPTEVVQHGIDLETLVAPGSPVWVNGPIIDGTIVPTTIQMALAKEQTATLPIMVGATDADVGFLNAPDKAGLFAQFGEYAAKVREVFDPAGNADFQSLKSELSRELWMIEPSRFVAQKMANAGQASWFYRFAYVADAKRSIWKGAPHASDIPFFFDTVGAKYGASLTRQDASVAKQANAYVINFVKTGNPNGKGLPPWPKFQVERPSVAFFSPRGTVAAGPDPLQEKLDVVQRYEDALLEKALQAESSAKNTEAARP